MKIVTLFFYFFEKEILVQIIQKITTILSQTQISSYFQRDGLAQTKG